MKPWLKRTLPYAAVVLATASATLFVVRARAAGIPEADVLTYTGYLEDGDGAPLTGEHSIEVQFLDAADATSDLCTGSLSSVALQSGRFQVPLPAECTDSVKGNPNLWVDVKVDGASLGPTKLGAVPFAVEAGHASSADAAAGALDDRLGSIEGQFTAPSGFRATRGPAQVLAGDGQDYLIDLDTEDYDLNDEFDLSNDTFTVKSDGLYLIQCTFRFTAPGVVTNYASNLYVNGEVRKSDSALTDGTNRSCSTVAMLQLTAGDALTCRGSQVSGANQSIAAASGSNRRTVFEAVRLFTPPAL